MCFRNLSILALLNQEGLSLFPACRRYLRISFLKKKFLTQPSALRSRPFFEAVFLDKIRLMILNQSSWSSWSIMIPIVIRIEIAIDLLSDPNRSPILIRYWFAVQPDSCRSRRIRSNSCPIRIGWGLRCYRILGSLLHWLQSHHELAYGSIQTDNPRNLQSSWKIGKASRCFPEHLQIHSD